MKDKIKNIKKEIDTTLAGSINSEQIKVSPPKLIDPDVALHEILEEIIDSYGGIDKLPESMRKETDLNLINKLREKYK